MNESTGYKQFRTMVNALCKMPRIDRVENLLFQGMPDVNCTIEGVPIWIEMKYAKEKVKQSSILLKHKFSPAQLNWFLREHNAGGGGQSYALIFTDKHWFLVKCWDVAMRGINDWTIADFHQYSVWKVALPMDEGDKLDLISQLQGSWMDACLGEIGINLNKI